MCLVDIDDVEVQVNNEPEEEVHRQTKTPPEY